MKIPNKGTFKSINEFHIFQERKLGNGSFGVVKLAMHAATGKLYALKIINLREIPNDHEVKLIEREIKLHSQVIHPHIVTLWDTIFDDTNLYMVLQYAQKGNLFYYQNTKHKFSQPQTFLFFLQTLKAVQHLHTNNIIHRDIKPQNLLLDSDYNIKLCDFGWAAENIQTKRTTFCGTYEYMAPQMVFDSAYDYKVDIWALGVLLYEMIHGYAPFKGGSVNQVKQKMLKASYHISDKLSQSLKSLIVNLLKFDPNQRPSLRQISTHPWIQRMQVLISSFVKNNHIQKSQTLHSQICQMPIEHLALSEYSTIYSHNLDSEYRQERAPCSSKRLQKQKGNNITEFSERQLKNININFSINNFSCSNQKQLDVKRINSPNVADLRKKKSVKRLKSQSGHDSVSNLLSVSKLRPSRHKQTSGKKEERKTPTSRIQKGRNLKSYKNLNQPLKSQRSVHKNKDQGENHHSTVIQKIALNLKKHAIKQKNSPSNSCRHQQYSPRNFKQVKKVKSKDKSSFYDFSHL